MSAKDPLCSVATDAFSRGSYLMFLGLVCYFDSVVTNAGVVSQVEDLDQFDQFDRKSIASWLRTLFILLALPMGEDLQ